MEYRTKQEIINDPNAGDTIKVVRGDPLEWVLSTNTYSLRIVTNSSIPTLCGEQYVLEANRLPADQCAGNFAFCGEDITEIPGVPLQVYKFTANQVRPDPFRTEYQMNTNGMVKDEHSLRDKSTLSEYQAYIQEALANAVPAMNHITINPTTPV